MLFWFEVRLIRASQIGSTLHTQLNEAAGTDTASQWQMACMNLCAQHLPTQYPQNADFEASSNHHTPLNLYLMQNYPPTKCLQKSNGSVY